MKIFSQDSHSGQSSQEDRVRQLVAEISRAEAELHELLGEEIDAVLSTSGGAPVMLRQAQEVLRASENRYRRLTDRLSAVVFELAPDGTILFANEATAEVTGHRPEKLVGKNCWKVFFPEEQRRHAEELFKVMQSKDVTHYEIPLLARNGSEVILDLNSSNHYSSDGTLQRIVGIGIDISEKREFEIERERVIAELEATIGSLPGGLIIYNPTGEIARINAVAASIFGYTEEDLGRPLRERTDRLEIETTEGYPLSIEDTPPWKALREHTVQKRTLVLRRPEGRKTWVACSAAPIKDEKGRLIGAVATFTDTTEVHELQQQRNTYIHTISHDLRNPLMLIQGYSELIGTRFKNQPGFEETAEQISVILEGARKMTIMIEDLVDAARLGNRKLKLHKRKVRLPHFMTNLLQNYDAILEGSRIECKIPENLTSVFVDPDRLERIMLNLLTNALKYSEEDSLVTLQASRDNGQVTIEVIDRGQGIDEYDLPHIFERFYECRGQRRPDSVGLGLFITRRLVEAHGGHIRASSRLGEGSTFTISLPAV